MPVKYIELLRHPPDGSRFLITSTIVVGDRGSSGTAAAASASACFVLMAA
jgi:hypothetical protein